MPYPNPARVSAPHTNYLGRNPCLALLALAALAASGGAFAANECQVKYAYATSMTSASSAIKNLDAGKSVNIPNSQGSKVLYVENKKNHPIRVYRTGIGQYVDLGANQRDPALGNYIGGVTLQKVQCHVAAAASNPVPNIEQIVAGVFQAVSQAFAQEAQQLQGMMQAMHSMMDKTVSDWGSCPSTGAQNAYNQAKAYRAQIDALLAQAQQVRMNAEAARNQCLASTGNAPLCLTTYDTLPVHAWIGSLTAARNTINTGIQTMASLQCPSGCAQPASLPVPYPKLTAGGSHSLRIPGMVNLPVCTNVDLGSIGFNTAAVASGDLAHIVNAKAPSCTSVANIPVCTDWDLTALLAELKRLKIVPPNITAIELDIPTRKTSVVTGVAPAKCQKPLQVCAPSGSITVSLNEGKGLFSGSGSCGAAVTVSCQSPPFGLAPTTTTIDMPDLAHARVSWPKVSKGSITVDLTAPNFAKLCRGNSRLVSIPKPPTFQMGVANTPLPFICTQPTFTRLIANL